MESDRQNGSEGGMKMKKLVITLGLTFFLILALKTGAMAQDEVQKRITMYKNISSLGESYGIDFELWGANLKKVSRFSIRVPDGKRIQFNNRLNFNNFLFSSDNMNSTQFSRQFPEGIYKIDLSPRIYGRFEVNMLYNFPNPLITYPSDGATDVPLNLTIQWDPLQNIGRLTITIKSASNELTNDLPTDATSFTPNGGLDPNTQYDVSLRAEVIDFEANRLITTLTISFTTGAQ
jgi:Bacterial Ig-like domain